MSTIRIADADVAYCLTGEGTATVLITQGVGLASAEWWPIQDTLSSRARVVSWDRAGYGDSGPPSSPRSVTNVAGEALDLLGTVAPDGPLVLVGHSQGGLYTNALARMLGPRVQGVALLDPAHPDNARLRRELPPKLFRRSGSDLALRLRMGMTAARLHVIGAFKPLITKGPPFVYCQQHQPEALKCMWLHMTRPQAYNTALKEYEELEFRTTPSDLEALGPFPRVPLTVLVHDPEVMIKYFVKSARLPLADAQEVEGLWERLLRDNASLSPFSRAETVTGSGYLIHLEKPELTVARIAELIKARSDVKQ